MNKRITIEVCVASPRCIQIAHEAQAQRIELCASLIEGGITPPLSWIEYALSLKSMDVNVLIRPRAGNFVYSNLEYQTMQRDLEICGEKGCNGVVFGILDEQNMIDINRNKVLVKLAKQHGMNTTFHRAIDTINKPEEHIETIAELGFDRILSSGGKLNAKDGIQSLNSMIERANNKIIIMPGSGVNSTNITRLVKELNTQEFHGSFSKYIDESKEVKSSSLEEIREVIKLANESLLQKQNK